MIKNSQVKIFIWNKKHQTKASLLSQIKHLNMFSSGGTQYQAWSSEDGQLHAEVGETPRGSGRLVDIIDLPTYKRL